MGNIRNTLTAIFLSSLLSFSGGCSSKNKTIDTEYISGTVLEESSIGEKRFGNYTYSVKFRIDNGEVYIFAIKPSNAHLNSERKDYSRLEALNLAIEEGTKIRIDKRYFNSALKGKVGSIYDHRLEVLGKD